MHAPKRRKVQRGSEWETQKMRERDKEGQRNRVWDERRDIEGGEEIIWARERRNQKKAWQREIFGWKNWLYWLWRKKWSYCIRDTNLWAENVSHREICVWWCCTTCQEKPKQRMQLPVIRYSRWLPSIYNRWGTTLGKLLSFFVFNYFSQHLTFVLLHSLWVFSCKKRN